MKHGVIHDYSLPCKSSPFAVYGIWHQYIADISSHLDRDWNYFSWICWKISILTVWVCQSVVQVATQGHEIPCMGNSLVGTPGLAGFFLILREIGVRFLWVRCGSWRITHRSLFFATIDSDGGGRRGCLYVSRPMPVPGTHHARRSGHSSHKNKTRCWENPVASWRGKRRMENPMSLALVVRRALQQGKFSVAYVCSKRQYCISSEDRHRHCDLWPFDPNINGYTRIIVQHLYVKFGDPSWISFWDLFWKNRRRVMKTLPTRMPSAW